MVRRTIFLILLLFLNNFIFSQDENNDSEELFELKVKEMTFTITPTFKLIVPETSVLVGINQKIGETDFLAQTEYNYLHSKINYLLKYTVDLVLSISFILYDNVNFEKIFDNRKFLQRNKGYGVSFETPKFFNFLSLRNEIKNENYYFASIQDRLDLNTGNILFYNSWLEILFQHKVKKDFYFGLNFEKAIPTVFSELNFSFLNIFSDKIFYFENKRSINIHLEYGYLLTKDNLPVWKIYNLGGFDRLLGFSYDEFQGYYKIFSRIKAESLLYDNINLDILFLKFIAINGFLILDYGNVGNVYSLMNFYDYKLSLGAGVDFLFLFRNKIKITITLAIAQAVKPNYSPAFYFIYFL